MSLVFICLLEYLGGHLVESTKSRQLCHHAKLQVETAALESSWKISVVNYKRQLKYKLLLITVYGCRAGSMVAWRAKRGLQQIPLTLGRTKQL